MFQLPIRSVPVALLGALEMSSEGPPAALVWLNALEAQAGVFEISLIGAEGTCKAEVTVEGDGA